MFWDDIREIKESILRQEKRILDMEVQMMYNKDDIIDKIKVDINNANNITDKIYDYMKNINKINEMVNKITDKIDDYMKNINKINEMVNELKGCVSIARATLKEKKEYENLKDDKRKKSNKE